MIEAAHLNFSYGKQPILHDISLSFEKGKLYAIIGPNGSGKTTLLHTLARLRSATGTLTLDNRCYSSIPRKDFAKKLALLPQERHIPDLRVLDLVSAGRFPYLDLSRRLSEADMEIVKSAMKSTEVDAFAEKHLKALSGGERQRAYLAMLTAQNTPYVLLDEPTSHLDISCAFEVMKLLCRMRDEGKCVIAVLHDLSLALRYADELIVMKNGKTEAAACASSLLQSGVIEKTFGVTCQMIRQKGVPVYVFDAP